MIFRWICCNGQLWVVIWHVLGIDVRNFYPLHVVSYTKIFILFQFPCQSMISLRLLGLASFNFTCGSFDGISISWFIYTYLCVKTLPIPRCWWLLMNSLFIICFYIFYLHFAHLHQKSSWVLHVLLYHIGVVPAPDGIIISILTC